MVAPSSAGSARRSVARRVREVDARDARPRTPLLVGVSLGYFMVLLDMTVLSVAEPDLAYSLQASIAGLQWVTTGYTVTFGALLLSAGAVADRYGAHRVFRAGVAAFGALSLLSILAPSVAALVALRVLLGVAGAAIVPASLSLVARLYPDVGARARAVAVWATVSGAAVAAGPIVGGVLVDLAGWRAVFLVNAPIAAAVLVLTAGSAIRCPLGGRAIDWVAQLSACIGLALLTDAMVAVGSGSWIRVAASASVGLMMLAAFVLRERRSSAPTVDRALVRSSRVMAGLLVGAAVNFALNGSLFVLPLLLQQGHQLTAVATGLAFLPLTLPFVLNPPITGRLVARFGPRPPILVGMALLSAGGVTLGCAAGAGASYAWFAVGLLLSGFGVSFVLPALVAAIVSAAPDGAAGAAGGLLNAVRQIGATLGVACMGLFVDLGVEPGSARALFLSAAVCAAAGAWFATARAAE